MKRNTIHQTLLLFLFKGLQAKQGVAGYIHFIQAAGAINKKLFLIEATCVIPAMERIIESLANMFIAVCCLCCQLLLKLKATAVGW